METNFLRREAIRLMICGAIAFIAGYIVSTRFQTTVPQEIALAQPVAVESVARKDDFKPLDLAPQASNPAPGPVASRTGLIAKLGVTAEDLRITGELNRRAKEGEYVLMLQRPTTRKFLQHDFKEIVAGTAKEYSAEYDRLFSEVKVQPFDSDQLKHHLGQIHQASLEATVAMQQLIRARQDYDTRMRTTLTEEQYGRYRELERERPALNELSSFKSFIGDNGAALSPVDEEQIVRLMVDSEAFTKLTSHGPYDVFRAGAIGKEQVINRLTEEQTRIADRANKLLALASEAELPSQFTTLLHRYYSHAIDKRRSEIASVKAPRNRRDNPVVDDLD